jgi:hypothetical protein
MIQRDVLVLTIQTVAPRPYSIVRDVFVASTLAPLGNIMVCVLEVQLNNVQSGIYLVTVQDGNRKEVKKIVVE